MATKCQACSREAAPLDEFCEVHRALPEEQKAWLRRQLAERAEAQAEGRAAVGDWRAQALRCIRALCRERREFTAEDVRDKAGDPPAPNALGAVMYEAQALRIVVSAGVTASTRPEAHGRMVKVWRAAS